ncbi:MAG: DEAD/DEAH box helicase family protein, partial [Alphaproteobacteria bacterium]|nr:DEAD/DEAH box helicase family protein [Alphaproteobacteria bacterium]
MNTNNEEREVTIPEILAGIIAYKNRVQNFKLLKDGIEKKYVDDELDLEDRQQESVLKLIEDTEEGKCKDKGYFHACTAFGKTYLMMAIAESYRHNVKNKKIVIFEENSTVLEQVKKDFIEKTSFLETDVGAYYGKEKTPDAPIIVCTYASMKKLIAEVGRENIGLALCDEAHHILSENRQEVAKYLDHSCLYGFTATPEYDDVKSCAQVFGRVIDSVTLRQGINNGLLCGFKNGLIVSKIPVDLSEALDSSGDYNQEKLKEIFKQSHLHGMREELADFYLHGQDDVLGPIYGKTTMINVPSQEEAYLLAEVFNQKAGKTIAKAYHTNSGDAPLEEFNQNKFPVLIQVNRLTEGYSNPNIEVCINYPTSSVVKSAQRSGRALRRNKNNPNKVALIMDIAFKKSNDLDTISAIKANKQVLFSDIAQEFMMLPRDVNVVPSQETDGNAKEKVEINENELFDIITDYENLFEFGFAEALHTESTAPQRIGRDATDINKTRFGSYSIVKDKDGNSVGQEIKSKIYDKVLEQRPDLFIKVQSGPKTFYVVPIEKREEFRKYLQETSFDFDGKTIKIENIKFHDEKETVEKNCVDATDINKSCFGKHSIVKDKDGNSVGQEIKSKIYDKVLEQRP